MKSQRQKVLDRLKAGHSITQMQALRLFGSMRLGAIIFRLRQEFGDDYIATETIPVTNRFGKTVYVARYLL